MYYLNDHNVCIHLFCWYILCRIKTYLIISAEYRQVRWQAPFHLIAVQYDGVKILKHEMKPMIIAETLEGRFWLKTIENYLNY